MPIRARVTNIKIKKFWYDSSFHKSVVNIPFKTIVSWEGWTPPQLTLPFSGTPSMLRIIA